MSHLSENAVAENSHADQRIYASLDARLSWTDKSSGEKLSTYGNTVNLGATGASVSVDILPPVGEELTLSLSDGKKKIISISATVIRVERDPAKPKAALLISKSLPKWRDTALHAAQEWVSRDLAVNYEGDDWLN